MSSKRLFLAITAVFFTFTAPCWALGSADEGAGAPKQETSILHRQPQQQQEAPKLWTGEGGKGISLAAIEPVGKGLTPNDQWLLPFIHHSITGDLGKFSAMTVFDRQNLEKLLAEHTEFKPGEYSDEDYVKIGQLTNARYILNGTISKTGSTYTLEFTLTDTQTSEKTLTEVKVVTVIPASTDEESGETKAAETAEVTELVEVESGKRKVTLTRTSVTQISLENLSAVKGVSAELLTEIGVALTDRGLAELKEPLSISTVNAETSLARGIIAQRQGKEAAALSYLFQAASLSPSLAEAEKRSSALTAQITGGIAGKDLRDDLNWRRDWVARLTETENFISALTPPYTLFYSTMVEVGTTNYQTETVELKIQTNMQASWIPFIQRALQVVYDGLNATNRKNEWGLAAWPSKGLTNANPFASQKQYNIQVAFELLNDKDQVIGKQTSNIRPAFGFTFNNNKVGVNYTEDSFSTVSFNGVKINDITDILKVRIASVTGTPAQSAQLPTVAFLGTVQQWNSYRFYPLLDISNGVIRGFKKSASANEIAQYSNLIILPDAWGTPLGITSVKNLAFYEKQLTSVSIPDGAASIGDFAFAKNQLTGVSLPDSVTSIGKYTFSGNRLTVVTIPDSVTSIGEGAFSRNRLSGIIIPNSVKSIGDDAFSGNSLTGVTIPGSVTSIGKYAFAKNQIAGLTLSNGVTSIGEGAFTGNALTGITIPNTLKNIEKGVFSYNRLSSVTIPNGVTSIGDSAFADNQLSGVAIPHSVTSIGAGAFRFNQITSITIGSNVKLGSGNVPAFDYGFDNFYNNTKNKKAGTYRLDTATLTWK